MLAFHESRFVIILFWELEFEEFAWVFVLERVLPVINNRKGV
jgi:hypothetical protein